MRQGIESVLNLHVVAQVHSEQVGLGQLRFCLRQGLSQVQALLLILVLAHGCNKMSMHSASGLNISSPKALQSHNLRSHCSICIRLLAASSRSQKPLGTGLLLGTHNFCNTIIDNHGADLVMNCQCLSTRGGNVVEALTAAIFESWRFRESLQASDPLANALCGRGRFLYDLVAHNMDYISEERTQQWTSGSNSGSSSKGFNFSITSTFAHVKDAGNAKISSTYEGGFA